MESHHTKSIFHQIILKISHVCYCFLGQAASRGHPRPILQPFPSSPQRQNSFTRCCRACVGLWTVFHQLYVFGLIWRLFELCDRFSPFPVGVFQACLPSGSQKQTIKTTGVLFLGNYALKEDTRRHLLQGPHIICHRILVNSILRSQSLSMKISQDFLKLGRSYDPVCPSNFMSDSSLQDWG